MFVLMRGVPVVVATMLVVLSAAVPLFAQSTAVYVSATDWPPYTKQGLVSGGATTEVVRTAFGRTGLQAKVIYDAWPNAIELARKATGDVVAYFPGYHCRHRAGFIASGPIGHGPLGFAEHVDAPLEWETLDDIGERKLKIGTVRGYANTDEFDTKVGMGWIHAIPSKNDVTGLQKLLRKRLDAVVIDKLVLEYLKATNASLKHGANKLRFNKKLLENKTLYLCFRGDDEGNRLRKIFNRGLDQIDTKRIIDDYFAKAFPR